MPGPPRTGQSQLLLPVLSAARVVPAYTLAPRRRAYAKQALLRRPPARPGAGLGRLCENRGQSRPAPSSGLEVVEVTVYFGEVDPFARRLWRGLLLNRCWFWLRGPDGERASNLLDARSIHQCLPSQVGLEEGVVAQG